MKQLHQWAKQFYSLPIFMAIVCIGLALSVVAQNVTIGIILEHILTHQPTAWSVMIGFLALVLILRATLDFVNGWLGERLAHRVRQMIRGRLLHQVSRQAVGERLTMATETLSEMLPFYRNYLPQVFKSTFIPLAIIVTMLFVHIPTALIMLVTAPFIPVFYIVFGLKTRDDAKNQMTFLNQFGQRFLSLTKGLVTLKLFNRSEQAVEMISEESTQFRDKTMTILKSAFLSGLMLEFISMLGIGLVALEVGLSLIVFQSIHFGTAAIAMIMAPEFYNAIKDLGQAFHTGKESEGASDVIHAALEKCEVVTGHEISVDENQTPLIQVRNLQYHYPNTTSNVLTEMHLDIFEGDRIALVGPSGAGKSTFVRLLIGELLPQEGRITYQRQDLKIGYLSQNPYIFNATIAENVAVFNDVPTEKITAALEAVQLMPVVQRFHYGIETLIGEGGEMLSGGEMRRIELARLLLLEPDFVVLDEPVAGLDSTTEQVIQQTLDRYFQHATRLTIAHRQSTIQHATRRIYLADGTIQSDDDHIQLSLTHTQNGGEE
ncbi:TPA: ABC transporter ATP-binding protein/permease [Staphylococcus pseudintermedius]|uniref:ABC transporter ATP-binding protein/permease n=1 Tax=Staphylococcus pseudintermedius TaxID=283734 RepID=UPI0016803251|nr:ABC transporter ATP-binding protein/permease [Staphylococcus pseudintermedius]EGQ0383829.1 ABC transporter ATP-binding protein/permease [Staphylococcus pseudintermedius]EGQ1317266.1 ATP-binding cassette domain-containing protein [Staphylococcus pseudintermedius]EGQ2726207.1 ABC transporter ATP-binding protein/permease [Staphylococcus pseudintermedius]EGQ2740789.1 ABC transporter ATP-binding protein/permease [Staphylococcus pseudintermedius]EGQ3089991.1 ABC transporter ATP-binding protein/pe